MAGEEKPKEEEKTKKTHESAKDYFHNLGLNKEVAKNTFSEQDAIAILEKAASDLKKRKLQADTAKRVLNQAWGIFKILI